MEIGRRLGWIDDEKMRRSTLALPTASAAPVGRETTLAPLDDIVDAIAANSPTFAGSRGRHRR